MGDSCGGRLVEQPGNTGGRDDIDTALGAGAGRRPAPRPSQGPPGSARSLPPALPLVPAEAGAAPRAALARGGRNAGAIPEARRLHVAARLEMDQRVLALPDRPQAPF